MQGKRILALALTLLPLQSLAQECEKSFKKLGDPRSGMAYIAHRDFPGRKPADGIAELESHLITRGFYVGAPLAVPEGRVLYYTQSKDAEIPIAVLATANTAGRISLSLKTDQDRAVTPEQARIQLCEVLDVLGAAKPGSKVPTHPASASNRTIDVEAVSFSQRLKKDVTNAMRKTHRRQAARDGVSMTNMFERREQAPPPFQPLFVKYLGRRFRVDGEVYSLSHVFGNVDFVVSPGRGLMGIRGDQGFSSSFSVQCILANDQQPLFDIVSPGSMIKLEGVATELTEGKIKLSDCRQAD